MNIDSGRRQREVLTCRTQAESIASLDKVAKLKTGGVTEQIAALYSPCCQDAVTVVFFFISVCTELWSV